MDKQIYRLFVVLAAALLLSSCGAFNAPTPVILSPEMIGTAVVETSAALATQTALSLPTGTATPIPSQTPRPTETGKPTLTPSETPSPTATWVRPTSTNTAIATKTPKISTYPGGYAIPTTDSSCLLISQSPENYKNLAKNASFNAVWTVANITSRTWNRHEVDFVYVNGTKMQTTSDFYDLTTTTATGERVTMTIPMKAPGNAGTYSATWIFKEGNLKFCPLSITIVVK